VADNPSRRTPSATPESTHETVPELPAAVGPPHSQDLSLASVPVVVVAHDQVAKLPLDARQGFVLSLIDGQCTFEEIIDMCVFDRVETIEIVARFIQTGIVVLTTRRQSTRTKGGKGT
jgi:hypothetical protein